MGQGSEDASDISSCLRFLRKLVFLSRDFDLKSLFSVEVLHITSGVINVSVLSIATSIRSAGDITS